MATASKNTGIALNSLGQTVSQTATSAFNTVSQAATSALSTVSDTATSALSTASDAMSLPALNSSLFKAPNTNFKNTGNSNWGRPTSFNLFGSPENMNVLSPDGFAFMPALGEMSWLRIIITFLVFVGIFLLIFYFYSKEIALGWNGIVTKLQELWDSIVGKKTPEPSPSNSFAITEPPPDTDYDRETPVSRIVENTLPILGMEGKKQVFNVETNKYTYYDAEPLCRSLGAELATYDQVKEAWEKGADWCNYGWVKGQVAIYPIQDETYQKLQTGPPEERGACGDTGINGGYFDNPEMRFGVNCYGPKGSQSAKAAAEVSASGGYPKTVEFLGFDKKVKEFKLDADSLDVMPFNSEKWSEA
jgi:hypothetical protein